MKEMKIHGIVFDCDGTLMDSLGPALDSFSHALSCVGESHRTLAEIKSYFGAGADRIFQQLLGDNAKALAAFEHYLDHQTELAKTTQLHDGIKDVLDILQREEIPMAVVTGRHARDLEIVLKPHRLAERFAAIVTDDHLQKSKPAPDGILLAAKKMGIPPTQLAYIGDSVMDMHAAHAAGSISIAALWDRLANPQEMANAKPGFMAQTPSDALKFIQREFSRTGFSKRIP